MVDKVNDFKALTAGKPSEKAKVALVYDLSMPKYDYRNEQGESVTVDIKAPRGKSVRSGVLSNLVLA